MVKAVIWYNHVDGRQITHFEMPVTIFFLVGSDVPHKGERVLQIIEHRNRGDNSRLLLSESGSEKLGGEKIQPQRNIFSIKARKLPGGGIDSDYRQARVRIK